MRLVNVKISGFRRFEETTLDLDMSVVAIVGPNEAGKSSLLEALTRVEDDEAIAPSDITRGIEDRSSVAIECRYLLERQERELATQFGGIQEPRWFVIRKGSDGKRKFWVEPGIGRDQSQRLFVRSLLAKLLHNPKGTDTLTLNATGKRSGPDQPSLKELVEALIGHLESKDEMFPKEALDIANNIRSIMEGAMKDEKSETEFITEISKRINHFVSSEGKTPSEALAEKLVDMRPAFVLFRDDDRRLISEYTMESLRNPPSALRNLFELAGVSPKELYDAVRQKDHGKRASLQDLANENLRAFTDVWNQSGVYPYLQFEADLIRIHVPTRGTLAPIAERSEGLRSFVCLLAFVRSRRNLVPPVLLIDEAERHLHYDAQADLINVLEEQTLATSVIYTTHSAGCLPRDLGRSVRAVVPKFGNDGTDTGRSTISTSFWSEGLGSSTLLFVMGASALYLVPSRRVVFCEGLADAILLPSMFREACGVERLRFQILPSLSNVSNSEAKELEMESPKIACLLDGDGGGKENGRKLISAGVPSESIVYLRDGYELEDYLKPNVYLQAVEEELRRSHGLKESLDVALPSCGRTRFIETICTERGLKAPSKTRVAKRIVEMTDDSKMEAEAQAHLREIYDKLRGILRIDM